MVYYAELSQHWPYAQLGGQYGDDIFHVHEATAFCNNAAAESEDRYQKKMFTESLAVGTSAGGPAHVSSIKSLYIGSIANAIRTGGDTNPELFVAGGGLAQIKPDKYYLYNSENLPGVSAGASMPRLLVMVNGSRSAATAYDPIADGVDAEDLSPGHVSNPWAIAFGRKIASVTGWNVSDMYYVNNWPGTPLTQHKPDANDVTNKYVTQVNYVSGYVCNASLH
ncbi:hypothetical protein KCD38_004718 [Salmonella enterica subsp. enterica serovar Oranienburg]|nr:hypothetical protein [Salmonella enterica subsp. enterica serovar Oranienburg]